MAHIRFHSDDIEMARLYMTGFCIECGSEREACEPDAREYRCDVCGAASVYGAEELILMRLGRSGGRCERAVMSRARDISDRLAERADEVCYTYLSNGRRAGNYWLVGDVRNAKGKSLWVRLRGPRDLVGRWRDEAEEGAYGDLLDLIRMNGEHATIGDAMAEAERFLGTPQRQHAVSAPVRSEYDSVDAARRLFARGVSIAGTLGEVYLRSRALTAPAVSRRAFSSQCDVS